MPSRDLPLGHHLFDTLYHAVALCEPDTIGITADEAYSRKARTIGHIALLRNANVLPPSAAH